MQFTVYRNKSARSKSVYPYLVDVQSELLDDLQTRVVVPLAKTGALTKRPLTHLTPVLEFDGDDYVLVTPQLAGIPRAELGAAVGHLADARQTIIAAIDFLITGF